MRESDFQSRVIKWLKEQGCYVIKNTAQPGVPVGCPDIFFCKGRTYGFLEIKPSATATFQPLQKATLEKLSAWTYAKATYPEIWADTQKELVLLLSE